MNWNIILITVFFVVLCLYQLYCEEIRVCDSSQKIFITKGQITQMKTKKTDTAYSSCINTNSSMIFDELDLHLGNTTKFEINGITWPGLPEFNRLEEVIFDSVTPIGSFGGCPVLKSLTVSFCNLSNIKSDWLIQCTNLKNVTITGIDARYLHDVLHGAPMVEKLEIKLDNFLYFDRYPIFTNVSHKHLRDITILVKWANGKKKVKNRIKPALTEQLALLPNLEKLDISSYNFDICQRGNFESVTFPSLKLLHICAMAIPRVCFRHYLLMPQLESLEIEFFSYYPSSFYLKFLELTSTEEQNLTVLIDQRYSPILYHKTHLEFTREDYLKLSSLTNPGKVTFFDSYLGMKCDCKEDYLWLRRAMHSKLINGPTVACSNGVSNKLQCERAECERVPCPGGCVCCRIGPNDELVADCRGANLTALPGELLRLRTLTELLAPNNRLTSLPEALPDNLILLDLSGNNFHHLNGSSALFAAKQRRWRLSGNPLECSCALFDTLQYSIEQLEDYDNIECFGELGPFKAMMKTCKERQRSKLLTQEIKNKEQRKQFLTITIVLTTVLAFAAIAIGVAVYYRRGIKTILFAHGLCLWWLRNNDDDVDDRRYDIFLSFCHEDADFVCKELLPQLDENYSVCVHFRNWMLGEMIPANIRQSVKDSKRTLIVLSRNFAKSLWGLMEFQTAYASSLEEGRVRVVMVLLDDVLEMQDLNKEYKDYVQFNTYVQWGDPWFWRKLHYALPHKIPRCAQACQQDQCVNNVIPPPSVSPQRVEETPSSRVGSLPV